VLEPLFSKAGRYQLYARLLAGGLLVYLFGGFILAKGLLTGNFVQPSLTVLIGLPIVAAVFSVIHTASMKSLDAAKH